MNKYENIDRYSEFLKGKKKIVYKAKYINDVKEFRIPNIDLIIHIDMEPEWSWNKFSKIPTFLLPPILPTEINFVPEENVIFGLYVWGSHSEFHSLRFALSRRRPVSVKATFSHCVNARKTKSERVCQMVKQQMFSPEAAGHSKKREKESARKTIFNAITRVSRAITSAWNSPGQRGRKAPRVIHVALIFSKRGRIHHVVSSLRSSSMIYNQGPNESYETRQEMMVGK